MEFDPAAFLRFMDVSRDTYPTLRALAEISDTRARRNAILSPHGEKVEVSTVQIPNVPFTFSRWCISGLVNDCACRRCLRERGETPNFWTEVVAARRSQIESDAFHERTRRWLATDDKEQK